MGWELCIRDRAAPARVVLAGPGPHATVHVIAADSPGVEVVPVATMDPTRPLSRVRFTEAAAEAFPAPADLLPRLRDLVWALLAVEQVGAAAAALRLTVEYTKTRKQFGRVIGSFQALKHRMADMYADVETARSIAYAAVDAIDTPAGAQYAPARPLAPPGGSQSIPGRARSPAGAACPTLGARPSPRSSQHSADAPKGLL